MSTHASSTFPTMANPPFHSCCKQELVSKPRRFLKCTLSMSVCMLLWQPRGHNPEKNYGLSVCSCLWMWATGREGQMVSRSHKDSQLWEWERGGTSDESHGVPVKHTNSSLSRPSFLQCCPWARVLIFILYRSDPQTAQDECPDFRESENTWVNQIVCNQY